MISQSRVGKKLKNPKNTNDEGLWTNNIVPVSRLFLQRAADNNQVLDPPPAFFIIWLKFYKSVTTVWVEPMASVVGNTCSAF